MVKQIDLEIAKSWFVLAQIFIILAGFFFASAGISYTRFQTNLGDMEYSLMSMLKNSQTAWSEINGLKEQNRSIESIESYEKFYNLTSITYYNSIKNSGDFMKINFRFFTVYTIFGFIFAFISLYYFNLGRNKLIKLKTK